jgi:membrane dipeptidase
MKDRARALHEQAIVVDGHNHIHIELRKKRYMGERAVFSRIYAPLIRQGGVNVLVFVVGGDSTSLVAGSDLPLWGTLEGLDMMWLEAEESSNTMAICLTAADIDNALKEGKIALILALEGGRPLEGKPTLDTLGPLRCFYRLGIRHVQLVDMGRNRLGDGVATYRTKGGLTPFGIDVVKECNRLGMVVDVAHLNDPGFWDVVEVTQAPIVDSHSNTYAICPRDHNCRDERMRAIAQTGGVIGLNCLADLTMNEKYWPTTDDWLRHLDHAVEVAGIDHVGIGADHFEDHSWSSPGWMEGYYLGLRDHYHLMDCGDITQFPALTEAMVKHGYSDEDIKKILGENLLRVYREVLGKGHGQ